MRRTFESKQPERKPNAKVSNIVDSLPNNPRQPKHISTSTFQSSKSFSPSSRDPGTVKMRSKLPSKNWRANTKTFSSFVAAASRLGRKCQTCVGDVIDPNSLCPDHYVTALISVICPMALPILPPLRFTFREGRYAFRLPGPPVDLQNARMTSTRPNLLDFALLRARRTTNSANLGLTRILDRWTVFCHFQSAYKFTLIYIQDTEDCVDTLLTARHPTVQFCPVSGRPGGSAETPNERSACPRLK